MVAQGEVSRAQRAWREEHLIRRRGWLPSGQIRVHQRKAVVRRLVFGRGKAGEHQQHDEAKGDDARNYCVTGGGTVGTGGVVVVGTGSLGALVTVTGTEPS